MAMRWSRRRYHLRRPMDHTQPLLLARDLRVVFRGRGDPVVAVDGISLELE